MKRVILTKKRIIQVLKKYSIVDSAKILKICYHTLYRYIKSYNINVKLFYKYKKCKHCKKKYKSKFHHGASKRQLYCSSACLHRVWLKNNKLKTKQYHQKFKLKKKRYCVNCNKIIPKHRRTAPGYITCSIKCGNEHANKKYLERKKRNISKNRLASKKFKEFKEKQGCYICKYNKCGRSLDYHHINPSKKSMRIQAKHWISNSKLIKKELEKCVLLCKNCHYEVHDGITELKV